MSPELKDLVKFRLERASEALLEADLMFNNSHLYATLNRCYYAAFYSVSALLLIHDLSSSKHSRIRSMFQSTIIQPGTVSNEWGQFYNSLFDYRQKADYEDLASFNPEMVKDYLDKTHEFVNLITSITQQEIKKS